MKSIFNAFLLLFFCLLSGATALAQSFQLSGNINPSTTYVVAYLPPCSDPNQLELYVNGNRVFYNSAQLSSSCSTRWEAFVNQGTFATGDQVRLVASCNGQQSSTITVRSTSFSLSDDLTNNSTFIAGYYRDCNPGDIEVRINGTALPASSVTPGFTGFGLYQATVPFGTFKTGDQVVLYQRCNGKSSNAVTVRDNFAYLHLSGGASNGITAASQDSPTVRLNTPTVIPACSPVSIGSHAAFRSYFTMSDSYNQVGVFRLNGAVISAGDYDFSSADLPGTQNPTFTASGSSVDYYVNTVSKAQYFGPTTFSYAHNGIKPCNDIYLRLGPIGLTQVRTEGGVTHFGYFTDGSFSSATQSSVSVAGAVFNLVCNRTQFLIQVDGTTIATVNRTVQYSSNLGTLSETGVLPLGTNVTFSSTATGSGYIDALIDGYLRVRQLVTVKAVPPPVLSSASNPICSGNTTRLSAGGCPNGTINWSTNQQGAFIDVTPAATTNYTATCSYPGGGICSSAAASIQVLLKPTPAGPTLTVQGSPVCAGGTARLTATGCSGGVINWSTTQQGAFIDVTPAATTSYTATCTVDGCVSAPALSSVTVNPVPATPVATAQDPVICAGRNTSLRVENCPGSLSWSTTQSGTPITVQPARTTIYSLTCVSGNCNSAPGSVVVTVNAKPAAPTITGSPAPSCPGQNVTLIASGCSGTVNWSTSQQGARITVNPAVTTDYTATCTVSSCVSDAGSYRHPVRVLDPAPSLSTGSPVICLGSNLTLTSSGCSAGSSLNLVAGTSNDSQIGLSLVYAVTPQVSTTYYVYCDVSGCPSPASQTLTVTVNPVPAAPTLNGPTTPVCAGSLIRLTASACDGLIKWSTGDRGTAISVGSSVGVSSYSATCSKGGCTGPSGVISVTVNADPGTPVLKAQPATICAGSSTTLTATGCRAGATVSWDDSVTGAVRVVSPGSTTVYSARCILSGCSPDAILSVEVTVNPLPASPALSASSLTIYQGQSTTLTAAGCTAGTVVWSTGRSTASIAVSPAATATYLARCVSAAGCDSPDVSIRITVLIANPPLARDDARTTPFNTPVTVAILGNDSADDGSQATLTNVTLPVLTGSFLHGTGSIGADGVLFYTPVAGYTGIDQVPYRICNTNDATKCSSAAVTITIQSAPPVATPDVTTTPFNAPVTTCVLTNDTDKNGNQASLTNVTAPVLASAVPAASGSYSVDAAGCLVFTPTPGFVGISTVVYTICDKDDATKCSSTTLTVTVGSAPPVATPDVRTTAFNTPVTVSILANDTDKNGTAATLTNVTLPAIVTQSVNGTGVVNSDGTLTFTPVTGFVGSTTLSYQICDRDDVSKCSTTTVRIATYPDGPVISVNPSVICPGSSTTLTATGCAAGSIMWSTLRGTPAGSGASISVAPQVTTAYSATCYVGSLVTSSVNSVTVTVRPLPAAPTLSVSSAVICAGNSATITAPGCAGNVSWSSETTGSIIIVRPAVTTTYLAVCTVNGCPSPVATLTLTVNPVPPAPTVTADPAVICAGNSTTLTASGCAGVINWSTGTTGNQLIVTPARSMTYSTTCTVNGCTSNNLLTGVTVTLLPDAPVLAARPPAVFIGQSTTLIATGCAGSVRWSTGATGTSITVMPVSGATTYTAVCVSNQCSSASATVTVQAQAQRAPLAVNDSRTTPVNTSVLVGILGNDLSAASQPASLTSVTVPAILTGFSNGSAIINADGTLSYTPAVNFVGIDVATYRICNVDETTKCAPATVTITIVSAPPVATPDARTTPFNTPVTVAILGNDLDRMNRPASLSMVTRPLMLTGFTNGSAVMNSDGTLSYTPRTGYSGVDVATYQICDMADQTKCSATTVAITIVPSACAPGRGVPLTITSVSLDCFTGNICVNTCGGDGTPIRYRIPNVSEWSNQRCVMVGDDLVHRDPKVLVIFAEQSGQQVSFTYDLPTAQTSCSDASRPWNRAIPLAPPPPGVIVVIAGTPTGPTGQPLRLLDPLYSCVTGAVTYRYAGGDGSRVDFRTVGVSDWSADQIRFVEASVRIDQPTLRIQARQSGQEVSLNYDLKGYCSDLPASGTVVSSTVVSTSATPPSTTIAGGNFRLVDPVYNCATGVFTFRTAGTAPGATVEFKATGITNWTTSVTHPVEAGLRTDANVAPFTLQARSGGQLVEYTWNLVYFCNQQTVVTPPASPTVVRPVTPLSPTITQPVTPPVTTTTGTGLTLLGPLYDCGSKAFTFRSSGGNGSATEYMAVGITGWTAIAGPYTVSPAPDAGTFLLKARQNGVEQSLVWDWKTGCTTSTPPAPVAQPPVVTPPVSPTVTVPVSPTITQPVSPTVSVPIPPVTGEFMLIAPVYNCETKAFTFQSKGGADGLTEYKAIGITGWTAVAGPYMVNPALDAGTFTLEARRNGQVVTRVWDWRTGCSQNPGPTTRPVDPSQPVSPTVTQPVTPTATAPVTPAVVTGGALTLLAPAYDCASKAFIFRSSGGNANDGATQYMAVGITGWTATAGPYTVSPFADQGAFTLKARQNGLEVSYVWDWKAACGQARVAVAAEDQVSPINLYPNPARSRVTLTGDFAGTFSSVSAVAITPSGTAYSLVSTTSGDSCNLSLSFEVSSLPVGLYVLRLTDYRLPVSWQKRAFRFVRE